MQHTIDLPDESATLAFARRVAAVLEGGSIVYLEGTLGAGKTTFCRGVLQQLGHSGAVKSPTYTLVEPYALKGVDVYHFDLYRLGSPEELEYIGIRDYFTAQSICLIEWPERGKGCLTLPDVSLTFDVAGEGRVVSVNGMSERGRAYVAAISKY